jgi:hypothetical protein
MLSIALAFFDKLLEKLFLDAAKEKIMDYLDRRNVERKVSRASEAPAQALEAYFQNEKLAESQVELILNNVQGAITSAGIDAKMLASASLDAEKLTDIILSKQPMPESIKDERLEWPFQMALQIAADTLCNIGPRFSDWEKEAWRRSFEAFDKLLQNQETILQSVGPGGEGSLDERFEHTYRSHILRRLAQIDASTFRVSSSLFLDLTTVFVQPDVIEMPKKKRDAEKIQSDQIISLEEARKQFLTPTGNKVQMSRVRAEDYISKHKRCAIVGLPGSGKTTLLQHLLLVAARGDLQITADGMVPVFIKVRQLDLDELPEANNLLRVAESRVFAGARPGFLQRQFEAGRILFLIDGLDEVVDDKRENLTVWISDFIDLYPQARYVVSSRPAGYQSEVFQHLGFSKVTLCEFNSDQIREYVRRWTKAVEMAEGATLEEADSVSAKYATTLVSRAESNPYVQRIATNPLLLSTLCLVQRYEGGDLPNRRVVLYQRCVEGLLFHWDNKRGLPPAILGSLPLERKIMLLRRLALEMQVKGVAEIDEDEVENSFGNSLQNVGEQAGAKTILSNIRDRSGLMVERRPWVYGFSHLTFQEYLAALSINQGDYRPYDRLFLFSKRDDPQWAEVIALYAGIASRDSVESLLRELLSTKKPESFLLCGECLAATQDASLGLQKEIVRAVLSLPNEVSSGQSLFPVQSILESLNEQVVLAEAGVLDNLSSVHSTRYLFFKNNPESIPALLEAGRRILTAEQDVARWDYGITLILLRMKHIDSARALGRLSDIASKENDLGARAGVLMGFVSNELWEFRPRASQKERTWLPGVLSFLDESNVNEEILNICKFIRVVSEILPDILKKIDTGELHQLQFFMETPVCASPPEFLMEKLEYIANSATGSLAEDAAIAATNLPAIITATKSLARRWSPDSANESQSNI